ncbi:hypothetical protein B4092_1571 [Bacillus licheniformis]|nr:hypothetical protein B4092_1571 [Bacillus licheniformis]OLF94979.1 hypothetical protein B4089_0932 [Bacillus licheniformis]
MYKICAKNLKLLIMRTAAYSNIDMMKIPTQGTKKDEY